ncbi:hypothetical protein GCM10023220_32400 [Streptomyces ziwulingensis]|uniref:Amino acid permease/ SLC12A domain-containing protein n=1 Tax=Streptomyces ziwulingensis TaxID=1045501 RepID=A0ABP9BVV8_9ACTN
MPRTTTETPPEADGVSLSHGLKQRHLSMIALGGVIGAGLFVGSGAGIAARAVRPRHPGRGAPSHPSPVTLAASVQLQVNCNKATRLRGDPPCPSTRFLTCRTTTPRWHP